MSEACNNLRKRYVVTGASGVVGSAVINAAVEQGINVTALTRGAEPSPIWHSTDYSREDLETVLAGADAVIHLAGTKGDKTRIEDFADDYAMANNLLHAADTCGVNTMIYASSRLVYADPRNIPWTEDTVPAPVTAYGINKVRIEEMCRSWCEDHSINITAVRIAQVLSERDHMRNMVNVFRELAREGRELKVMGRSEARRQYIYAHDLAKVLLRLCDVGTKGFEIVNAGMELAYTNLEIAEAFNAAYGNTIPINYDDSKKETITSSIMDVSRMIELTGIVPMDLKQALADMAGIDG